MEVSVADTELNMSAKGWITNANYNVGKGTFILFINNRLVSCAGR